MLTASGNGVTTTVQGTLNSIASQAYQLDFFGNTACDPSGNGEGQYYLGSVTVLTDGSGNGVFNTELPTASPGQFITATATDPFGNTSEFSPCFQATIAVPPMTFSVINTNDSGAGSLRQAILDSNAHLSSENNTIAFNIFGAGMQTIKLSSALPAFVCETDSGKSLFTFSSIRFFDFLKQRIRAEQLVSGECCRLDEPHECL